MSAYSIFNLKQMPVRYVLIHSNMHPNHISLGATRDMGSSASLARVPSRPQADMGRLGTRATLFWPDFKGGKNSHFSVKFQEFEIEINSF